MMQEITIRVPYDGTLRESFLCSPVAYGDYVRGRGVGAGSGLRVSPRWHLARPRRRFREIASHRCIERRSPRTRTGRCASFSARLRARSLVDQAARTQRSHGRPAFTVRRRRGVQPHGVDRQRRSARQHSCLETTNPEYRRRIDGGGRGASVTTWKHHHHRYVESPHPASSRAMEQSSTRQKPLRFDYSRSSRRLL